MILHALVHPRLPTPRNLPPRIARDFVATVLRELRLDAEVVDDATLCTSELVTNACVRAKGGDGAALWLGVEGGRVRVVVYDRDESPPVAKELAPDAWETGGRGLYLVDALTHGQWGHGPAMPYGKAVWFDLAVKAPAPVY
ncbi:ATP-binding protein [Streptomyces sp. DT2A-34]|uniref:ATP-binding protein n=1 Tax=Streptomyces sp. DT2A-34 TaxID=3051182 RepID=UPI00265B8840|nr:ATP-binding protein [Streptomyces sp. DT2A-34]MDO0912691.1 ATP-binding protein [Streptomyces sp. DT2A-34]